MAKDREEEKMTIEVGTTYSFATDDEGMTVLSKGSETKTMETIMSNIDTIILMSDDLVIKGGWNDSEKTVTVTKKWVTEQSAR